MADEADEEHDEYEELTDSVIDTGPVESKPLQEEEIGDDRDLAEAIESGKSIFKVMLSQVQVMSGITGSVTIPWPEVILDITSFFDFVQVDIVSIFGVGCVTSMSYYRRLYIAVSLPLFGPMFI